MTNKELMLGTVGVKPENYEIVSEVSSESKGLTIFMSEYSLFFSFCGTKGAIWPPSNDWLKNLFVWPKSSTVGTDKYFAHTGFVDEYNELRDTIFEAIKAYNPGMIFISGFSQGGAHATLCFRDLSYNFSGLKIKAVSFAGPRVYTEKGSNEFNYHLKLVKGNHDFERITVYGDPVPHLPPWLIGYSHVGKCKYIGKWTLFPDVKVHDVGVYRDSL